MAKVAVCVSNDLSYDQRVRKQCNVLLDLGHEITLIGRVMKGSKPIERPYRTKRLRLGFHGGALFYASLNIKLFFFLLFLKCDAILCNDLDTLPAGYLISRLRGKKLIYDSHEFFTESAGLTGRPFPKKVWEKLEAWIFPKLKTVYTVNDSFAEKYKAHYGMKVGVVRNIPPLRHDIAKASRSELGLPEDKKIVLLQGAYIDIDRGAKELAEAVSTMDGVILLVIGAGAEWEWVNDYSKTAAANGKILVKPKMPYEQLAQYTRVADVGASIDKDIHINYKFSLPNKLFDYIHAGLPVLVSDLVELRKIVDVYKIGKVVTKVTPEHVKTALQEMLDSDLSLYQPSLQKATAELNWERESLILREILAGAIH